MGTDHPWIELHLPAVAALLYPEHIVPATVPEIGRVRRRVDMNAIQFHVELQRDVDAIDIGPPKCMLDAIRASRT